MAAARTAAWYDLLARLDVNLFEAAIKSGRLGRLVSSEDPKEHALRRGIGSTGEISSNA